MVYLLWLFAPAAMPAPPGLPRNLLPLASPLNCILPVTVIGSGFLILIGLRKLILGVSVAPGDDKAAPRPVT